MCMQTVSGKGKKLKKKKFSQAPCKGVESVKVERLPVVPLLEPENYKTINQNCNFQLKNDSTLKSDR